VRKSNAKATQFVTFSGSNINSLLLKITFPDTYCKVLPQLCQWCYNNIIISIYNNAVVKVIKTVLPFILM